MKEARKEFGRSAFIVSLDFEQHWGLYDLFSLQEYSGRLEGGRRAIPLILEAFECSQIHATWAVVGLLMCRGRSMARTLMPVLPSYASLGESFARTWEASGESEAEDPAHFCPSVVERIAKTPNQEIASHTFSHFYCLEEGPTLEEFEEDLRRAKSLASDLGYELTSIVFPRNQYSDAHLSICCREGFTAFRGNPDVAAYRSQVGQDLKPQLRAQRLVDSYLPLVASERLLCRPHRVEGLVNVPASRFLRPLAPRGGILERLKVRRILQEMTLAAELGVAYHLWWHPYNFGANTSEHLELLQTIIRHYQSLRKSHGMRSLTIFEASKEL